MKRTRKNCRLTKRIIDAAPQVSGVRLTIADTEVPGLQLVAGEASKTFVLEKRIRGQGKSPKKITIGRYPALTLEQARNTARRWSLICRNGDDPTKVTIERLPDGDFTYHAKDAATPYTVGEALQLHLDHRKMKPRTADSYQSIARCHLACWTDTPLTALTLPLIQRHTDAIARNSSLCSARQCMKVLHTIWETAFHLAPVMGRTCPPNPLKVVNLRKVYSYEPRRVVIPLFSLGRFISVLEELKDSPDLTEGRRRMMRVYLLQLFLGMRIGEALNLKWEYIDMEAGYFRLPGKVVKNGRTHIKPVGEYPLAILKELQLVRSANSPYVFPAIDTTKTGAMSKIDDATPCILERMPSGFEFTTHAMRRTFVSLADEMGVSRTVLKQLVNHISGDVTDKYCIDAFNPLKTKPELDRIQTALLELRDRYNGGEPAPESAKELAQDGSAAELKALRAELAELRREKAEWERNRPPAGVGGNCKPAASVINFPQEFGWKHCKKKVNHQK